MLGEAAVAGGGWGSGIAGRDAKGEDAGGGVDGGTDAEGEGGRVCEGSTELGGVLDA